MPFKEIRNPNTEQFVSNSGGKIFISSALHKEFFENFDKVRVFIDEDNRLFGIKPVGPKEDGFLITSSNYANKFVCAELSNLIEEQRYYLDKVENGILIFRF